MSRFQIHRHRKITSFHIGIALFAAILVLFLYGISYVSSSTGDRQEASLINAMERNIVHCYALEGFYPPSLNYIEEHYGLTYDETMFIVDYQPIGTNIYPDFTIRHPRTGKTFYYEHFGMMDDPRYSKNAYTKLQLYNSNGIFQSAQLITTFETKTNPLSSDAVENIIKQYFL